VNGQLREELSGLQRQVGELRAEKESFQMLKMQRESDRIRILEDLEADPIGHEFTSKDDLSEDQWLRSVGRGIKEAGFKISDRLLYAFHTALKCQDISPVTLLMGISGTGKSELPRLYSDLGGLNFHLAAVQPNWDSPTDLFGFYNYAEARPKLEPLSRYLLQFLPTLSGGEDQKPRRGNELLLVLLDEMNLARVEYYFSDLLSRLEARRSRLGLPINRGTHEQASISLDMGAGNSRSLFLDTNVLFVGTLNQDESTLDVSDKVIDRANAITFPRPRSFSSTLGRQVGGTQVDWRLSRQTWDQWCRRSGNVTGSGDALQETFKQINTALRYVERGVAHRVFQAVQRYTDVYPVFAAKSPEEAQAMALVDQFAMKILPKLKGVPTETQDGKACLDGIQSVLPGVLLEDYNHARRGDYFEWQGSEKLFEPGT
jgi:hypothetical protein